ncbi:MAG: protein kinase [Myxococcales bacterium]
MATLCPNCGVEFPPGANFCPRCTTADPKPVKDAMCGRVVGERYRILRKLGQGGMGVVYEAEHVGVGQKVAIKFLHATFSGDAEVARRFHNEAKSYAQIVHPHAVQLHDFGRDADGNLYICMEYLEGCDLKRTLAREGRLPVKDALDVVQQVADVLGTAHARGIVHRDLKPENLMLSRELRGYHVKVLDFGLARLADSATGMTAPGMVCGTPRYMAPEQSEGLPLDHRVDIYALGLVLFETLTGTHPFDAPSISETLRLQRTAPVPHLWESAPELRLERVDAAIQRATAKRPDARFGSMLDFVRAFSDDVASVTGNPAIAPTAEDVAATSARLAVRTEPDEPVGATLPSAPRREAAKPAPPVASKPIVLSQVITPMAAPVGSGVLEEATAEAPKDPKKGRGALVAGAAALVIILAAVGVGFGLRSGGVGSAGSGGAGGAGESGGAARQKLEDFYKAQRELPPPEACRERDPQLLEKLAVALPKLVDDSSDEVRSRHAGEALASLPQGGTLSAEAAFLRARALAFAGKSADDVLAKATACPGFASAESLAGKLAYKAGRKDEAVRRLTAALVPGYARPRLILAVVLLESEPNESFRLLEEAVAIQPDFAEAHFALGRAHEAKSNAARREGNEALAEGERAQSKAAYCKAAELGFEPARRVCPR